ncbi:MAG: DUF2726 domain-containing protein [Bacillota bacterium]|jgi:very-short-patch-repair endonuclease
MDDGSSLLTLLVLFYLITLPFKKKRKKASPRKWQPRLLGPEQSPYQRHKRLLTPAESSFFRVLSTAVQDLDVHIFAKVRMGDLLFVPKDTMEWKKHWYRIQAKHVDFVLCDKARIEPLAVVELDDSSHQRTDRMERDRFVERVYGDVGLPLLRFPVKRGHKTNDVSERVRKALGRERKDTDTRVEALRFLD